MLNRLRCVKIAISMVVMTCLLVTNSPMALTGWSTDKLAPPSEVQHYADEKNSSNSQHKNDDASRSSKAVAIVDAPADQWVPQSFWDQVGFLEAIDTVKKRSIQTYRHFFALSGFFSAGVLKSLDDLAEIEDKAALAGAPRTPLKVREARAALAKLAFYLPGTLKGKNAWVQIDPAVYTRERGGQRAEGLVAEALDQLGWGFTRLGDRAIIARKGALIMGEFSPAVNTKLAMQSSPITPSAEEALTPQGTALVASHPRISPAQTFNLHRQQTLGRDVRSLCEAGRFKEAANILVLGSALPEQARAAASIMRGELSFVQTGLVLRLLPDETAAYLLALAVAVGERGFLMRDVTAPWKAKPQMDNAGLAWACEVLRYTDHLGHERAPALTSRATDIVRQMIVREGIPFGPEVAAAIIVRSVQDMRSDPDLYDLGFRMYHATDAYFQPFKILNPLDRAAATGNLYTRDIPKERRITGEGVTLTSREELVDHVCGLFHGGMHQAGLESRSDMGELMVLQKVQDAARILFLKLDPLIAYDVMQKISIQVVTADEDLVYLLPCVPAQFAARFFVEINQAVVPEKRNEIFEWTMDRLADLQRRGVTAGQKATNTAKEIVHAMLMDEFVSKGGRELFRKILDPKTTHKDYGVVLQLYEALYRDDPSVVDWFTFFMTGKLYAKELTEPEARHRVTDWAEEMLLMPANRFGAEDALEHLERIRRLGDGRVIPYLISVVNRRYQTRSPSEWGMTQVQFDAFNAKFLRAALAIDPAAFAKAYWTHRGNVPELRSGFLAALRRMHSRLGPEPIWGEDSMNRLVLQCLSPEEQTDLVLRGVREGTVLANAPINERIMHFIQYGLTQRQTQLDLRVVAAAAFMHSGRCLMELRPLVGMTEPCQRLADLYRSRSVLDNFDLRFAGSPQDRYQHPFQGEHVDVAIALGPEKYRDLIARMTSCLDSDVGIWDQAEHSGKALPGADFTTRNIVTAFYAPLQWQDPPAEFLPLLKEYAASIDLKDPQDLNAVADYVRRALLQKPPEKAVKMKELIKKHDAIVEKLNTPLALIPPRWKEELSYKSHEWVVQKFGRQNILVGSGGDFLTDLMCFPLGRLLERLLTENLQIGLALTVMLAFWGPIFYLFYLVQFNPFAVAVLLILAIPYCYVFMFTLCCLAFYLQMLAAGLMSAGLLTKALIHLIWHHVVYLPGKFYELGVAISSMQALLPQLDFDPAKPLKRQIPALLLESAQRRLKGRLDVVSEADENYLNFLISDLEGSRNPLDQALVSYAKARRIYLTKQLPGRQPSPTLAIEEAPMRDQLDLHDLLGASA